MLSQNIRHFNGIIFDSLVLAHWWKPYQGLWSSSFCTIIKERKTSSYPGHFWYYTPFLTCVFKKWDSYRLKIDFSTFYYAFILALLFVLSNR